MNCNKDNKNNSRDRIAKRLDLLGVRCPMNFVHIKLALEEMQEGELLEVLVDEGEPAEHVPKSLQVEGHRIIKVNRENDGVKISIEKGGD